ncbi:MAG: HlyD family efflux transporter periplasmic adaptor subunit, partial [Rubrivivax sp.]|nr:HlyD family efflux transporter periplasmic adaptor subunit [Pyrinomonadaceae bacterium]
MSAPLPQHTDDTNDSDAADLAALGKSWAPPQAVDTSPEVSDVIATMPWWAARGLLYIILGFVVAAFTWAWLSKIDVVIEARGKLVPEGYVKLVQAASPGTVQGVLVREGETVAQGQPLVQLDATEMRARLARLREELTASQQQLRQLMSAGPVTETLEQKSRIARLQSEIAATELGLRQTTITSPAAGVVTSLDVRGGGEVLQAGQSVASIAPADAPLMVEAHVSNRDIAFVEPGLAVKLKLDAFPYQDYGAVEGTVSEVAPDAQTDKDEGSFYKVLIKPRRRDIVAKGKTVPLRPGLALSASIITERKSVLKLLF